MLLQVAQWVTLSPSSQKVPIQVLAYICYLFKTDATNVYCTIKFLMKARGRLEKTKDFEKSHQYICCIFKPSGCEGEIIELKAHKKILISLCISTTTSPQASKQRGPCCDRMKKSRPSAEVCSGRCDSSLIPALHSACSRDLAFHITVNPFSASSMPTLLFHPHCS